MGKNAYLVITDTHLGNMVTSSRKNYRDEIFSVEKQLLEIAIKYKKADYNVIALFLGDIFHNSYKDVTDALLDKDFINLWRLKVGEIFTVMGNHEFTYYKANPFYTSIASIESELVQKVSNKVWTPLGVSNILRVVDTLEDGEVSFYFNHYGTGVQTPTGSINIGLFHQELVDPQIRAEAERTIGKSIYAKTTELENSGILAKYDYCFLGHMHSIYGVWKAGKTYLHYLASLGRTNETEVRNDFLERNVPCIIVEDGKFISVQDNFITLLSREESIVEEVITKNKERYTEAKEIRSIRDYVPLGDNPIENLQTRFAEEPNVLGIISDLLKTDEDFRLAKIKRDMRGLNIGNR